MTNNRWVIAIAGVVIEIAFGAVYAWSVFRTPLATRFGWSISEVTLTFTISIVVLGITAFLGGILSSDRLWSSAHRTHAADERQLSRRASRNRHHHVGLYRFASCAFAAATTHQSSVDRRTEEIRTEEK
jgi:phosphate/sulfate permease